MADTSREIAVNDEGDVFQEIALDDAPVRGPLYYHGVEPANWRCVRHAKIAIAKHAIKLLLVPPPNLPQPSHFFSHGHCEGRDGEDSSR